MKLLPIIYLAYMFVAMYFLSLFFILYLKNRKTLWSYPETNKKYTISFIIPAYNEERIIKRTIEAIFNIDYGSLEKVIVVNDCSTDNTRGIVEKLLKKYKKLKLINNRKNLGNAARVQNVGLKHVTSELVAVVDADSVPRQDSIKKMVGWFDDSEVGAVTCPSQAINKRKFLEKLQDTEYNVIAFTRKLLDYVDAIYVTPGTLALYRKKALDEIGGFDENNMTQDIEATWHLTDKGWKRRMTLNTAVGTNVMSTLKTWFAQRRRWNVGGLQCLWKYKSHFFKRNMLGLFILPFFALQLFLGLIGLSIFLYLFIRNILTRYFSIAYTLEAGTSLLTLQDFYITPSFLNYLGIILFILGTFFTILVLYSMTYSLL